MNAAPVGGKCAAPVLDCPHPIEILDPPLPSTILYASHHSLLSLDHVLDFTRGSDHTGRRLRHVGIQSVTG